MGSEMVVGRQNESQAPPHPPPLTPPAELSRSITRDGQLLGCLFAISNFYFVKGFVRKRNQLCHRRNFERIAKAVNAVRRECSLLYNR